MMCSFTGKSCFGGSFFYHRRLAAILLLLIPAAAAAQYFTPTANNTQFRNAPYGFISELPRATPRVTGSGYLDDQWAKADIVLDDSTMLRGVSARADFLNRQIEIDHDFQIKVLPFRRVMAVHFPDAESYVRLDRSGRLYRVVISGAVSLLCLYEATVRNADYNAALDVGRRDHEVRFIQKFVITKGGSIVATGGNRGEFVREMKAHFPDCEELVKKISLRREASLIRLVRELNARTS